MTGIGFDSEKINRFFNGVYSDMEFIEKQK
jgi:hypothetical protein